MKELWAEKHAPKTLGEMAGQKRAVEEAVAFVKSFRKGKALFFAGPSGTGKSAAAECLARGMGMSVLRLDAGDERGKEAIEGFMPAAKTLDLFGRKKLILIEEVDGLAAGDRGGAGAIAALIRESSHPVILTANDTYLPKLRPLREVSKIVRFSRVPSPTIEKRLREICAKEGIEAKGNVLASLARWSNGDLRSAINDLEMAAKGKGGLEEKDLEVLGFRERTVSIFDCISSVFRSGSIRAARSAADNCDTDPEYIFMWAASNLHLEYSGSELEKAYRVVSHADVLRGRIIRQQNYRFRLYMLELVCGLSAVIGAMHRYVMHQPPRKLQMLGRMRGEGNEREAMAKAIGRIAHCSSKKAKGSYMPYLGIIYGKELGKLLEPQEQK